MISIAIPKAASIAPYGALFAAPYSALFTAPYSALSIDVPLLSSIVRISIALYWHASIGGL